MKQTINIQLKLSEIIYDIQNKTFLTGRSQEESENPGHIANMQANDDEENASQILRSITTAYAVLRNRLEEFMETGENSTVNDPVGTSENIRLTLYMPSNFNMAVTRSIGDAAHSFIVAKALADWFAITAKGSTIDYNIVARESLKILEEALSKRSRLVRTE